MSAGPQLLPARRLGWLRALLSPCTATPACGTGTRLLYIAPSSVRTFQAADFDHCQSYSIYMSDKYLLAKRALGNGR